MNNVDEALETQLQKEIEALDGLTPGTEAHRLQSQVINDLMKQRNDAARLSMDCYKMEDENKLEYDKIQAQEKSEKKGNIVKLVVGGFTLLGSLIYAATSIYGVNKVTKYEDDGESVTSRAAQYGLKGKFQ